jgi:hypothetical protein
MAPGSFAWHADEVVGALDAVIEDFHERSLWACASGAAILATPGLVRAPYVHSGT